MSIIDMSPPRSPSPPHGHHQSPQALADCNISKLARGAGLAGRSKVKPLPKNEAMWSENFTIMGVEMQLEFFPQGRETTWMPGFCALFLWCPAGVHIRYRLRVGNHWMAPDVDDYPSKMGHGHSNFCYLDAQWDRGSDSVTVGVQILELSAREDFAECLRVINQGQAALLSVSLRPSSSGLSMCLRSSSCDSLSVLPANDSRSSSPPEATQMLERMMATPCVPAPARQFGLPSGQA